MKKVALMTRPSPAYLGSHVPPPSSSSSSFPVLTEKYSYQGEELILDGMICPISNSILMDPVTCLDGHSYERAAIDSWLSSGHVTSPVTGLPLASNALIPNHNLRRAIDDLLTRHPKLRAFRTLFQTPTKINYSNPSFNFSTRRFCTAKITKGGSVALSRDNTVATRTAIPQSYENVLLFIDGPLRFSDCDLPGITLEVLSTVTAFNGLMIGITNRDPKGWARDIKDLIDDYSFYINDSGWIYSPLSGSQMSGWVPGNLKAGDNVSFHVTREGNVQVHVNNIKQCDIPVEVPLLTEQKSMQNYWGFMALCGIVAAVKLITFPSYNFPSTTESSV